MSGVEGGGDTPIPRIVRPPAAVEKEQTSTEGDALARILASLEEGEKAPPKEEGRLVMTEDVKNALKQLEPLRAEKWPDLADFFIEFENICRMCSVLAGNWLLVLKSKISADFMTVLRDIPGYPALPYMVVRDRILNHYGPGDPLQYYVDQLAAIRLAPGETVRDLEHRFQRLLEKHEAARLRLTVPDEAPPSNRNKVQWWLAALPAKLRADVETGLKPLRVDIGPGKPRQYPFLSEVVRITREYEQDALREASRSSDVAFVCREKRTRPPLPRKKGGKAPPPKRAKAGTGIEGKQCFQCKGFGHLKAQCPSRKQGMPRGICQIPVLVEGRNCVAVVDSASTRSLINSSLFDLLCDQGKHLEVERRDPKKLLLADGSECIVDSWVSVNVFCGKHCCKVTTAITENLPAELLLGIDSLVQFGMVIDIPGERCFSHGCTIPMACNDTSRHIICAVEYNEIPKLSSKLVRIQAPKDDIQVDHLDSGRLLVARGMIPRDLPNPCVLLMNTSGHPVRIRPGTPLCRAVAEEDGCVLAAVEQLQHTKASGGIRVFEEDENLRRALTRKQWIALHRVLRHYAKLFDPPEAQHVAATAEHVIDTGDHVPITCAPYQQNPARRQFIEEEVTTLLKAGKIRPSQSAWASPVVLVGKKDGSIRFCVDYRRLNAITKRDAYPLPRIDDSLHAMEGMVWFSSFDLAQGYWQHKLHKDSKEKTAFVCHMGLFEWNVLPFGLTNAPATFQRTLDLVLAGAKWQCCLVYLDDILVFSKDFDTHMKDLDLVLGRLQQHGLLVKPQKCTLCTKEIKYLGHLISGKGVRPDPAKVAALRDMPAPSNVTQLQSFLGFANYYRLFVKNFAREASPLYALCRKDVRWAWGRRAQEAFEKIKQLVCNATLLHQPDWSLPFLLDTDGSKDGLGAVLSQVRDGVEEPLGFQSRTLSKAEAKWHCSEFEALAVVWGTRQFEHYLADRHFTVRVDHHNLRWLKTAKKSRLQRWALELQAFDYDVEYRRGAEHCNCDGLSRNPVTGTSGAARCTQCSETNSEPPNGSEPTFLAVAHDNRGFLDITELRRAQAEDEFCKGLIDLLCGVVSADATTLGEKVSNFVYENDLLFFVDRRSNWRPVLRLCIPEGPWRSKVIGQYHDAELTGHLGAAKTLGRLRERFYWSGMHKDVLEYVRSCRSCQLRKTRVRAQGLLQPIAVQGPWDVVGMDIFGELPITTRGNRWCLAFIDHFTKWPEIIPLRRIDAKSIADCIHAYIICRHGCPRKLLSDRGHQFLSEVVKRLCKRYGVDKVFTSPYHPQGDPQAEAFMKPLGNALTVLAEEHKADWDEFVDSVAFAYRSAVHPTTRYTPFFLNHLREPRLPPDLLLVDDIGELPTPSLSEVEEGRWEIMKNVRRQVHELLKSSQLASKGRYDQGRKPVKYQVGSLVLLRRPGKTRKLEMRWAGPFEVTEVSPTGLNVVIKHRKSSTQQRVHVDRVIPFHVRPEEDVVCDDNSTTTAQVEHLGRADATKSTTCTWDRPLGADAEGSIESSTRHAAHSRSVAHLDNEEYEVSKVLGYDESAFAEPRFLVRWKGYGPEHDSWEPEDALVNARDAVLQFKVVWNRQNPNCPFEL